MKGNYKSGDRVAVKDPRTSRWVAAQVVCVGTRRPTVTIAARAGWWGHLSVESVRPVHIVPTVSAA